jgi:hypothetical protein
MNENLSSFSVTIIKYDDAGKKVDEITVDGYGSLEELMSELENQMDRKGWDRYDATGEDDE